MKRKYYRFIERCALVFALMLCCVSIHFAQCEGVIGVGASEVEDLDAYSGAAAVYSVRLVYSTYAGSALEVRRGSDNQTQIIGFDSNGAIDTAALETFCSGTDCYVTTWYDQSGNGKDATQTSPSNQPQIYDSADGVVLENARPALLFDGDDYLTSENVLSGTTNRSLFSVHRRDGDQGSWTSLYALGTVNQSGAGMLFAAFPSKIGVHIRNGKEQVNYTAGYQYLMSYTLGDANITSSQFHVNGIELPASTQLSLGVNTTSTDSHIGGSWRSNPSTKAWKGTQQELLFYASDEASNREAIEENMNAYFRVIPSYDEGVPFSNSPFLLNPVVTEETTGSNPALHMTTFETQLLEMIKELEDAIAAANGTEPNYGQYAEAIDLGGGVMSMYYDVLDLRDTIVGMQQELHELLTVTQVNIDSVSEVGQEHANLYGSVTYNARPLQNWGFVVGTDATLATSDTIDVPFTAEQITEFATSESDTGSFYLGQTGLTRYTQYFAQSYASDCQGTYYSDSLITFFTLPDPPSGLTIDTLDVTSNSVLLKLSIADVGGQGPDEVTFYYDTLNFTVNTAVIDSISSDSTDGAEHSALLTGLSRYTDYFFNVKATNLGGSAGADLNLSFRTMPEPAVFDTIYLDSANDSLVAVLSDNGGQSPTGKVFRYSDSPEFANVFINEGILEDDVIRCNLANDSLASGKTYYVFAEVSNDAASSYSDTISFQTRIGIETDSAYDIVADAGTLQAQIGDFADASPTEAGFIWSTDSVLNNATEVSVDTLSGTFSYRLSGLSSDSTYYYSAYVENEGGRSYGDTLMFSPPWTCGISTYTYQGYAYSTVKIADQCWFSENLRTTHFESGDSIPVITSESEWESYHGLVAAAYDSTVPLEYGLHYNHNAVSDSRKLCPSGWRVPSRSAWSDLKLATGGEIAANLSLRASSSDSIAWNGTNDFGFSALPAGVRTYEGNYEFAGENAEFWSLNTVNTDVAWAEVFTGSIGLNAIQRLGAYGLSVRCLQAGLPVVETSDSISQLDSSVLLTALIEDDGGDTLSETGFLWSSYANLDSAVQSAIVPVGDSLALEIDAAILDLGTTYYFTAYASNSAGTSYSDTISFVPEGRPSISTQSASNISSTTSTLNAVVTNSGASNILEAGFYWSLDADLSLAQVQSDSLPGNTISLSIDCLERDETYYFVAFATNANGTSYGDTLEFQTEPLNCGTITVSYDNYTYETVSAGEDCWFKENLRTTTFRNGEAIPELTSASAATSTDTSWQLVYADIPSNLSDYGRLYNGLAVRDPRGVCPTNWHVPKMEEWQDLIESNGGLTNAHHALKSSSNDSPAWDGSNSSGFSVGPAGILTNNMLMGNLTQSLFPVQMSSIWSATESADRNIHFQFIQGTYDFPPVSQEQSALSNGLSVRCIHNAAPKVFTFAPEAVGKESAMLNGSWSRDRGAEILDEGFYISTNADLSDKWAVEGVYATEKRFYGQAQDLEEDSTYYYTAFARNCEGISTGDTVSFVAVNNPCNSQNSVTYDGFEYDLVSIGDQCWFAQDLRTTVFATGEQIDAIDSQENWNAAVAPAQTIYPGNTQANLEAYGRLYNGAAVNHSAGLCPTGYRVSTAQDWGELVTELGVLAPLQLKSTAEDVPPWNGLNEYGFSAVPAGQVTSSNWGIGLGDQAKWWTSTAVGSTLETRELLTMAFAITSGQESNLYNAGYSVRCVMTESTKPVVETVSASSIGESSAVLNFSVVHDGWLSLTNQVGFVWGDDSELTSASSDFLNDDGSHNLSDLEPGKKYYYSFYAANALGVSYGDTLSFETQIPIETVAATSINRNGATLRGMIGDYSTSLPERIGFYIGADTDTATALVYEVEPVANEFELEVSGLITDSTYVFAAFVDGAGGENVGNWKEFVASDCYALDYAGHRYDLVEIGGQCWFAENLQTLTYANGDSIGGDLSDSEWVAAQSGAWAIQPFEDYVGNYGRLYNGSAVLDSRGLCPEGWHVTDDADWKVMEQSILGMPQSELEKSGWERGTIEAEFLKSSVEDMPSFNGANTIGFNGAAAGTRQGYNGLGFAFGYYAWWWTPSALENAQYFRNVRTDHHMLLRRKAQLEQVNSGMSVRCVGNSKPIVQVDFLERDSSAISVRGLKLFDGGEPASSAQFKLWPLEAAIGDTLTIDGLDASLDTMDYSFEGLTPKERYVIQYSVSNSLGTALDTIVIRTGWGMELQMESQFNENAILYPTGADGTDELVQMAITSQQLAWNLNLLEEDSIGLDFSITRAWVNDTTAVSGGYWGSESNDLLDALALDFASPSSTDSTVFQISYEYNQDNFSALGDSISDRNDSIWNRAIAPGMEYEVIANLSDSMGTVASDTLRFISPPFVRMAAESRSGFEIASVQVAFDSWQYPIVNAGLVISTDDQFSQVDTVLLDVEGGLRAVADAVNYVQLDSWGAFNEVDSLSIWPIEGPQAIPTIVSPTLRGLQMDTDYLVYAFAQNEGGTSRSETISVSPENPCFDLNSLDYCGETYDLVPVEFGCFFNRNLAATELNDGTPLVEFSEGELQELIQFQQGDSLILEQVAESGETPELPNAQEFYIFIEQGNTLLDSLLGGTGESSVLYPWSVAYSDKGICPSGFELFADIDYLDFAERPRHDFMGLGTFSDSLGSGNNSTGFDLRPARGFYWETGNEVTAIETSVTGIWTSYGVNLLPSNYSPTSSFGGLVTIFDREGVDVELNQMDYVEYSGEMSALFPVRCKLSDPSVPIITTKIASPHSDTSATLHGRAQLNYLEPLTAAGFKWGYNSDLSDAMDVSGDALEGEFSVYLTGLVPYDSVYFVAYGTNALGTTYGDTLAFEVQTSACEDLTSVTYDGYNYKLVGIGDQCWFVENLRTTVYANGNPIPEVVDDDEWFSMNSGARCDYGNDSSTVDAFGRLYNLYAVEESELCPAGWHVPTEVDWIELTEFLGDDAGMLLKSSPSDMPSWSGTNSFGWSGLPGGLRTFTGEFDFAQYAGAWWSASDFTIFLTTYSSSVTLSSNGANAGQSVRCVRDQLSPVVSTVEGSRESGTSITVNGSVSDNYWYPITATGFEWGYAPDLSDATDVPGEDLIEEFSANITGLVTGEVVYFVAYATNELGTTRGDTLNMVVEAPPCMNNTVQYYHGYYYDIVEIGDQCWFAENLNTSNYADGTPIPEVTSDQEWVEMNTGARCDYNNNPANGRLYNWYAIQNGNLCPSGWHVPTGDEFDELVFFLPGYAGYIEQLKSSPTDSPPWNGTNATGWSGLPRGKRDWNTGEFVDFGESGYWWSSTVEASSYSRYFGLETSNYLQILGVSENTNGYSVRCLKDSD